jgi:aliphatic nitrilase
MIFGPGGTVISDTLRDEEGIVYADIDLKLCVVPKQFQDVVGYYNRFDVFELKVNRRALAPAEFSDEHTGGEIDRSHEPWPPSLDEAWPAGALDSANES